MAECFLTLKVLPNEPKICHPTPTESLRNQRFGEPVERENVLEWTIR